MTGGGIAQLARVLGSYPIGQAVKTPPFHGGIMGSIPVRVTNQKPWNEKFQGFLYFMGNLKKEEF